MATHELKTWPEYFKKIKAGVKTWELRKNDRDFKAGDTLVLKEFEPSCHNPVSPNEILGVFTGQELRVKVNYVFAGHPDGTLPGLNGSYCIMSITPESSSSQTEDVKVILSDLKKVLESFQEEKVEENIKHKTWREAVVERTIELLQSQPVLESVIITTPQAISDVWDHAVLDKETNQDDTLLKRIISPDKATYLKNHFNINLSTQTYKEVKP